MTDTDTLFRDISNPFERKRALAENARQVIQEIKGNGQPATDLLDKLNYLHKVLEEMEDL